jgi:hypothetical protein
VIFGFGLLWDFEGRGEMVTFLYKEGEVFEAKH